MRAISNRRERPSVGAMLKRPVDRVDQNLPGPVQRDLTGKARVERLSPIGTSQVCQIRPRGGLVE
jgi:hypothetical protein